MKNTVNLKDASFISGITQETLKRHIHKGNLPAFMNNGRYDIDLDDLEYFCCKAYEWENRRFLMYPYIPTDHYDRVLYITEKNQRKRGK